MFRLGNFTKQAAFAGLVAFAVLFGSAYLGASEASPLMATAPTLGSAASFAVLGGSTVTNTGSTTVHGNLGVSPGTAVIGFPPGIVTGGTIYKGEAVALQAQNDVIIAYNALAAQACDRNLTGTDLGGLTLTPGVYCFSSSAQLTGTLTLNALGDPNAVFVFQIGSTLTTASNSHVDFINAGTACNVFWQLGTSATLGTGTRFAGSILALASITLTTDAHVLGRALARNGAVTMDGNDIDSDVCVVSTATPTATRTATSTRTATPTRTSTATRVPWTAPTNTATSTPGNTPTATATSVPGTTPTAMAETSTPTSVLTSTPTPTPARPPVLPPTGESVTPGYGWWIVVAGLILSIAGFLFRRAGQRL